MMSPVSTQDVVELLLTIWSTCSGGLQEPLPPCATTTLPLVSCRHTSPDWQLGAALAVHAGAVSGARGARMSSLAARPVEVNCIKLPNSGPDRWRGTRLTP